MGAELVPSARVRSPAQRVSSPPQFVAPRLWGGTKGVRPFAPDFPFVCDGCAVRLRQVGGKRSSPPGGKWSSKLAVAGVKRSTRQCCVRCSKRLRLSSVRFGPAYRLFLRARAMQLGVIYGIEGDPGAAGVVSENTPRVIPSPVSAEEVERLLRAYVGEVPVSVLRAICARLDLLKLPGHPYWSCWAYYPALRSR